MGIRFYCPNGHKLNVKTYLAGKRGICPDCDAKFLVPLESGGRVEAISEVEDLRPLSTERSTSLADSVSGLATDVWHVRTSSGSQHGPATTSLIKSWITAGKVDRDSWVWRTGWLDWQRASDVFPELGAVLGAPAAPRTNPFVDDSFIIRTDDYMSQESDAVIASRRKQRQRRERIKTISLILGAMIFLLTLVLLVVLLQ